MTDAQQQVEAKIHDLMREHFDAGLFLVMSENDQGRQNMTVSVSWHGGYFTVKGMLMDALRELEKRRDADDEERY